jgi:glycosyltransferase involved in cell wall biosynthesis
MTIPPLKILMVSPTLGSAFGLEQVLMLSVEGLRGRGHQVSLVGETAYESLPPHERAVVIPGLFSTSPILAPRTLKKVLNHFKQAVESLKPDLIHFLDQPPAAILEWATQYAPCALTAHTVAPTCPASHRLAEISQSVCTQRSGWSCLGKNKTQGCLNSFKSDLHRAHAIYEFQSKKKATQKIKAIIAISRYVESTLLENGFSREQVKLIYNPLPQLAFADPPRSPLIPLIVSACRLVPLKGIEFGVRALKLIEHLPWQYWILGDGPLKNSLQALVRELKLESKIIFKGKIPRNETLNTIRAAQIFLQPNIGPEGFGLSVAEALALGTPAVAFDTPALGEIIENTKNGYLVPSKNIVQLSQAIAKLLTENTTRSQLSQYGKQSTPFRFSTEAFLNSTLSLYQQMVTQ